MRRARARPSPIVFRAPSSCSSRVRVRSIDVRRSRTIGPSRSSSRAIEVACGVVDIDVDDREVARVIEEELRAGFLDVEIVRNGDGRFAPVVIERAVASSNARTLTENDVVVASGGARGVTATTLLALARASRCGFVLLGRTPICDEPAACVGVVDEASLKRALIEDAKRNAKAIALANIGEQ